MISELAATALKEFCYFLIEYLKVKQTEQGTDGQTDRPNDCQANVQPV